MTTATLCLNCPDAPGIVHNVTGFIFKRGGNIVTASQHQDPIDNRFFMRVVFDRTGMQAQPETLRREFDELAARFKMDASLWFSENRPRMAIMVSKYDHCLYDLLLRHRYGEIETDIPLIVSNHPTLEAVAGHFGISFVHIPVTKESKVEAETKLLETFEAHRIDFAVLARYMQIITPTVLERYPHRIINVHHGFLPAFKGAKPYHQAYEKGVKLIGATSHYATEDLDMGPIIEQETIRVDHTHSVEAMIAMGRDVEKRVLARGVAAHAAHKILLYRNRTIILE